MKNDRDLRAGDPRLTAYALGELEPAEMAEVERSLEGDAEGRAAVEATRKMAETLEGEFEGEEPFAGLRDQQRRAIEVLAAERAGGKVLAGPGSRRKWAWIAGIAASFTLAWVGIQAYLDRTAVTGSGEPFTYTIFGDSTAPRVAQSRSRSSRSKGSDAPVLPGYAGTQVERTAGRTPADRQMRQLGYIGDDGEMAEALNALGYIDDEPDFNTEAYDRIVDNAFELVSNDPRSTFSIDVDTASYAICRRYLSEGRSPPPDAVRIEELVNYFSYDYPAPTGADPFSVNVEVASCPWAPRHQLVQIGLKGREIAGLDKTRNLVFLIDVSGSMRSDGKLDLLKRSLRLLVDNLTENDRVAIAVYAGSSGRVLAPTNGNDKETILRAIEGLSAGGSTNGGEGIHLAYDMATQFFVRGGVNRVILASDGDFNVGITDEGQLTRLIEEKAKTGVFLSVLGFGSGNLKDSTMEKLADRGNGNYSYIDSLQEARKVLVSEMGGTLDTIAKDVKIQVEFNPAQVSAFRLIGYENRMLAHSDFNDDTKDAGEIGAGHTVTAIYEIVPAGVELDVPGIDPLKYQRPDGMSAAAASGEIMTVKLRYKDPDGNKSRLIEQAVSESYASWDRASPDFQFAASVAAFGMILRDSPYKGESNLQLVNRLALGGVVRDPFGYRTEYMRMMNRYAETQRGQLSEQELERLQGLGYTGD